jgi:hypothetical protein
LRIFRIFTVVQGFAGNFLSKQAIQLEHSSELSLKLARSALQHHIVSKLQTKCYKFFENTKMVSLREIRTLRLRRHGIEGNHYETV